jgi:peptidoglycan/xylan/chitin deacetylase (PgdA/CDA1 family)
MTALARAHYHATTLDRVWRAWHGRGTLPVHPIVVSFDDGYLSDYTHARPELDRLHWPGVLNLEVHNVGPGGLTRNEIRELLADGWEVDAHTLTHPDLTTVDAARLRREVAGERLLLLPGRPLRRHRRGRRARGRVPGGDDHRTRARDPAYRPVRAAAPARDARDDGSGRRGAGGGLAAMPSTQARGVGS